MLVLVLGDGRGGARGIRWINGHVMRTRVPHKANGRASACACDHHTSGFSSSPGTRRSGGGLQVSGLTTTPRPDNAVRFFYVSYAQLSISCSMTSTVKDQDDTNAVRTRL